MRSDGAIFSWKKEKKRRGEGLSQKFPFPLSSKFLLSSSKKRGKVVESKVANGVNYFSILSFLSFLLRVNRGKWYANRCKSPHFISIYRLLERV